MTELRIVIDGVPSTDHRPRTSVRGGRPRHHRSAEYNAWKDRVVLSLRTQVPRGWPLDARYVVMVMGYLPSARYDADNLRGFPDAAEGLLWTNDRQVRPVTYDYEIDKARPRLEVHAVALDRQATRAEILAALARMAVSPMRRSRRDEPSYTTDLGLEADMIMHGEVAK